MGTKKSGGNTQNLVSTEDLIFTQRFNFSENNELKKLSAAPSDKCPLLSEDAGLPPCPCFKYVGPGQGRQTDLRKSLLLDNSRTCRQAFVLCRKRSVQTEIIRDIDWLKLLDTQRLVIYPENDIVVFVGAVA